MARIFTVCFKCGKEIPYGMAFVTFSRNVEYAEYVVSKNEPEIQVIDSEGFLSLCGSCGNAFDYLVINRLVQSLPLGFNSHKEN